MTAVVTERDRLSQGDVEATGTGDAAGDLGHFEGMGEPGALMISRKNEHLGLTGQTSECGPMEDPVAVSFEAGPHRVGLFIKSPVAWASCPCRAGDH